MSNLSASCGYVYINRQSGMKMFLPPNAGKLGGGNEEIIPHLNPSPQGGRKFRVVKYGIQSHRENPVAKWIDLIGW